jgi:hypothetical protein
MTLTELGSASAGPLAAMFGTSPNTSPASVDYYRP